MLTIRNNSGDIILNGSKKILRGKGMKRNNIVGNLTIEFTIIQPPKLDENKILAIKKILENI